MEAGRPFKVFKAKGGYRVEDPQGRTRGRRKRLTSAVDLAERLSLGIETYAEGRQVLATWPKLSIRTGLDVAYPYRIMTSDNIIVKRFLRRFHAEWWLEKYENRRLIRESQLGLRSKHMSLLDAMEERWLIFDSVMCYEERVVEIITLLRAGEA